MITVNLERPHICIDGEKYYVAPKLALSMSRLLNERGVLTENAKLDQAYVPRLRKMLAPFNYEIITETPKGHGRRSKGHRKGWSLQAKA